MGGGGNQAQRVDGMKGGAFGWVKAEKDGQEKKGQHLGCQAGVFWDKRGLRKAARGFWGEVNAL